MPFPWLADVGLSVGVLGKTKSTTKIQADAGMAATIPPPSTATNRQRSNLSLWLGRVGAQAIQRRGHVDWRYAPSDSAGSH